MTTYDRISKGYDTTRRADPYLVERLVHHLDLRPGAEVLDVGCGTGNYTLALQTSGLRLTGVDPSKQMLVEARDKSADIEWVSGSVEALPLSDRSFDGAIATLTTHHWRDLAQGFREVRRVLRPDAPLVLLTSDPEQMRRYWLCHYFRTTMERSCAVMPTVTVTREALTAAGFHRIVQERYDVRPDLQDLFLYSAKEEPERYLDPKFRSGISTFAALADDEEVQLGLRRLESDIHSGAWREVRRRYQHDDGDYLFIAARGGGEDGT